MLIPFRKYSDVDSMVAKDSRFRRMLESDPTHSTEILRVPFDRALAW
jgi:hypothetical protein